MRRLQIDCLTNVLESFFEVAKIIFYPLLKGVQMLRLSFSDLQRLLVFSSLLSSKNHTGKNQESEETRMCSFLKRVKGDNHSCWSCLALKLHGTNKSLLK